MKIMKMLPVSMLAACLFLTSCQKDPTEGMTNPEISEKAMDSFLNKISEDADKEPPIQVSPSELDQKWLPLNVQPSRPAEPDRKWQQLNVQPSKPAEPDRKWQQLNLRNPRRFPQSRKSGKTSGPGRKKDCCF